MFVCVDNLVVLLFGLASSCVRALTHCLFVYCLISISLPLWLVDIEQSLTAAFFFEYCFFIQSFEFDFDGICGDPCYDRSCGCYTE